MSNCDDGKGDRSPMKRVIRELKRWHGGRITRDNRPGPWWDHPGRVDEMAGPAERVLLEQVIDWSGVSEGMQSSILDEWWKGQPGALARTRELDALVEAVGGREDGAAIESLKAGFLDEAADNSFEAIRLNCRNGGGHEIGDYVDDGGYVALSCPTREGMRADYRERYGGGCIQGAYDLLCDSRRHFERARAVEPGRVGDGPGVPADDRGMDR